MEVQLHLRHLIRPLFLLRRAGSSLLLKLGLYAFHITHCQLDLRLDQGQLSVHRAQFTPGFSLDLRQAKTFFKEIGLLALRQLESDGLFLLVPQDADPDGVVLAAAQSVTEISSIVDRLVVHPDDYVTCMEAGFLGGASLLDRAHQDSLPAFCAKEIGELRGKILHHQTGAHGGMHHYDRNWDVDIGHRWHRWHRLNGRHRELEFSGFRAETLAVGELGLQRESLAIAADPDRYHAPRGYFTDHPPQLLHALDLLAVDAQDDVVFLEARLSRGSILVDHGHFDAALFLQLQGPKAVRGDVTRVHAQIRSAVEKLFARVHDAFARLQGRRIDSTGGGRQDGQNAGCCQNRVPHVHPPTSGFFSSSTGSSTRCFTGWTGN